MNDKAVTTGDAVGRLEQEFRDLKQLAEDVISGKARSYVNAAGTFAPVVLRYIELERNYTLANANLTEVQERCTELFEENRMLRQKLAPEGEE